MDELSFKFQETAVRTLLIEREPWFVGKDVAEALRHTNPERAVRNFVDDEDKGVTVLVTPGGTQQVTIINEPGAYSLILQSKTETAKKFKHWVTHDVLPSIRKQGYYSVLSDEELIEALTQKLQDNPKFLKYTDGLSPAQKKDADKLRREADYQELRKNWKTMEPREVTQRLSDIFFDDPRRFERENNKFIYWYNHNKISKI